MGRFDISTAVMTMSGFRVAPKEGHLERVKRIVGYLSKMRDGVCRFRVEEPDLTDVVTTDGDWTHSVCGDVKEAVPDNALEPKGKYVTTITHVDANLYHDFTSGKAVTGILHLVNKTPIDSYSKKQSTVETATYSSEFVAAKVATEQIMDPRLTLRYLGVPIRDSSHVFGDNESVVNGSMQPQSRLHKRHTALSCHRVREAIAAGVLRFAHVAGKANPADTLSKAWSHTAVWPVLRPLLFWRGDTADLIDGSA